MSNITKEQAVDLWVAFVTSKRSVLSTGIYGPGGGLYIYTAKAWGAHEPKYEISLITYPPNAVDSIQESTIKDLITPFGNFPLSVEDAKKCVFQFVDNVKSKTEHHRVSLEDVKAFLKN